MAAGTAPGARPGAASVAAHACNTLAALSNDPYFQPHLALALPTIIAAMRPGCASAGHAAEIVGNFSLHPGEIK